MDLMEFEAREIFRAGGIAVPNGMTVESADELTGGRPGELSFPVVVKAQVAVGGRGKAGGVRFANDPAELKKLCAEMLGMTIHGHLVKKLLIVEKAEAASEMYLSILLDRNAKKHVVIFSPDGGVEIEQTAKTSPEKIFKIEIDPLLGWNPADGMYLGGKAGLDSAGKKSLAVLIGKLYALVRANDASLAEINPLAIDGSGEPIALDAKISVDDNGVFRHSALVEMRDAHRTDPLTREAAEFNFLYIPCDANGDVVVMSNGSGMLMSCIDHIARNGRTVSAVLDLGGGATADRIEQAVRILFQTEGAKILFINIFGGITRCDEVAQGIRNAMVNQKITRPIIARFEGTNKAKGLEIVEGLEGLTCVDGLHAGVDEIVRSAT